MTHISLDIETWGTALGSDIRSIGAVVFDPIAPGGWSVTDHTLMNGETFYIATDNPQSEYKGGISKPYGPKYPLTRDPETAKWWNDQSPAAQNAFANPVDLREACFDFGKWFRELQDNADNIRIWANDPHFDVSMLDVAYRACGLPVPWHYRAPRSMRTIVEAAGMTRDDYCNYGDAHNALHDAIAQAMTVCEAYKRLGLAR